MRKVKLGFVGAGFMGQLAHLSNFVDVPDCEVVALAEIRDELRERVARKYGIPKTYKSHMELAQDDEIEAVVAILPYTANHKVALDLLNAGKHLLIEKPMTTSVRCAEEMVEAAEENGVRLMVGYMKRYDPGVEKAKEYIERFIQTGELGEISYVRAHCYGGDWVCNVGEPIRTDEAYPEFSPSPTPGWLPQALIPKFHWLNNVWCHNMNLLRFLLGGKPEVEHVTGFERPGELVIFNFGSFIAAMEIGGISAHKWDEETKVYFRDGWVEIETPPPLLKNLPARVGVYKAGNMREKVEPLADWGWAFRREDEEFISCILEGREPRSSGRDSIEDVRLMEEIFKSYLNGAGL